MIHKLSSVLNAIADTVEIWLVYVLIISLFKSFNITEPFYNPPYTTTFLFFNILIGKFPPNQGKV